MQDLTVVQKICQILYDKKAQNIVALNVAAMTPVCEYMVIASGRSTTQVRALTGQVEEELLNLGITPRRSEGKNESHWVILDYGFVLVHIFHPEEREYYNLERLWTDGENQLELTFDQTEEQN